MLHTLPAEAIVDFSHTPGLCFTSCIGRRGHPKALAFEVVGQNRQSFTACEFQEIFGAIATEDRFVSYAIVDVTANVFNRDTRPRQQADIDSRSSLPSISMI
jgi:hypothetical protein